MAWIVLGFEDTLVQDMGDGQEVPVQGALEAVMQLQNEGHRLTVWTSKFAPMPNTERQRLKEQIEQQLLGMGFPPLEVWTGFSKPAADLFIDASAITYDGDWNLALAQTNVMLEERGLAPGPMPDDGTIPPDMDPNSGEEIPQ